MNVHLGPTIQLSTHYGDFEVSHVTTQDAGAALIREGVVLRSLTDADPLIVRVQSSCLFSESFWATNCDCALQLQASLERVAHQGGMVLYFYEEGRGAGLATKFKAIELQQSQNMDTRAAYECLNMNVDSRSYEAAAAILKRLLGERAIVLLTNNPGKRRGLRENGVNVASCENLVRGLDTPAIANYLKEKAEILGHNIPGLL